MTEPRAYTEEEGRALFLQTVTAIFRYWRDIPDPYRADGQSEPAARMEGFLFSLWNVFDGTNMSLPSFDIMPSPHPDDEAYHRAHGEDFWSAEVSINASTSLHEVFPWSKLREPGMPDTPPPLPEQPKDVWLAVILHSHGTNFYAQPTKAKLDAEIAEYCREFANEEGVVLTDAMTDEEAIDTYFDLVHGEDLVREAGPVTV